MHVLKKLKVGLLGASIAVSFLASNEAQAAVNLGNIMPLGDSLTVGIGSLNGYRLPLYNLLHNNGYTFTFVGSQSTNSDVSLTSIGQGRHEGVTGSVIQNLGFSPGNAGEFIPPFTPSRGIIDVLHSVMVPGIAAPDYILLLIGGNDIANDYNDNPANPAGGSAHAPARLDHLISAISNKITGERPNAHLIVAELPPTAVPLKNAPYQVFNATLPQIIANHQALGENVSLIDLYSPLNPATDFSDGYLHPNILGYDKIATAFYNGIVAVPEPTGLGLIAMGTMANLLNRRIRRWKLNA